MLKKTITCIFTYNQEFDDLLIIIHPKSLMLAYIIEKLWAWIKRHYLKAYLIWLLIYNVQYFINSGVINFSLT